VPADSSFRGEQLKVYAETLLRDVVQEALTNDAQNFLHS